MGRFQIDDLLRQIGAPNREACFVILEENRELFQQAPGSSHNHQAWPGGYLDHITEAMNIGFKLFNFWDNIRPLPFTLSDLLLGIFLHDFEKPWRYELGQDGQLKSKAKLEHKANHQAFRMAKIAEYGITLTPQQENGIKYAEGEGSDYTGKERIMNPLAAMIHMADVFSARIWFDYPLIENDPWNGAKRCNA